MQKNAKLYRNALRGLVAALALGGLQVAHAGYAQLAAPSGYAGTSAGHTYAAAANDRVYGRVVHQAGALTANVGGQAVKMPAAYRLAANAPRIAAAVVFMHPGVRTAAGIATWLLGAKLVYDAATNTWREKGDPRTYDGYEYQAGLNGPWMPTLDAACAAGVPLMSNGTWTYTFQYSDPENLRCRTRSTAYNPNGPDYTSQGWLSASRRLVEGQSCPTGWTMTPAGCMSPALEQPQFVDKLAPPNPSSWPMPSTVPQELPYPSPLPVEQPFINPAPGENPSNRPQRVPTGDPVPIPNTDPQRWRQPYVDIVPSPTPESPWRVDVKPGEVESPSPDPVENPNPDTDTDKPTEEQDKSLCEKHPEILACSKPELDVPDGEIPRTTKQISYAEEGGFGGGACPSNVYANLHGKQTMVYEWTRTCSVVSTYIRPIILLLGAMGALFILIPGRDS